MVSCITAMTRKSACQEWLEMCGLSPLFNKKEQRNMYDVHTCTCIFLQSCAGSAIKFAMGGVLTKEWEAVNAKKKKGRNVSWDLTGPCPHPRNTHSSSFPLGMVD